MAGSITRRGNSWRLKFEAGARDSATGVQQTRSVTVRGTKRDAQRKLPALLAAVDNGTAVDPSRVTVAQHLRSWLDGADHLANKVRADSGRPPFPPDRNKVACQSAMCVGR